MKYQVIARKFRPQVFEEVVGQNPIVQTLKNAIEMDRIGHAYLFCGPRGVGKTTTARLLAKALNCRQGPTATPCNECASCQEISVGRSIDVLEIDAASNTGVDNIRELRENARYAPSRDRFKIFIVDEVHMLSTSAFNALLKILEEPPQHIAFILATTERHKLPATILSRCQQFVFRTIPPAETLEHLRKIAKSEGIKVGDGALDYVVKAAEGSMRDAQSLLDQIIAFGGQKISDEDVRDVLGFIPSDLLNQAVEGLIARDSKTLLDIVEIVAEQGLNLQQFVRELLSRIRDMLLAKLEIEERILASSEERRRIASQSEQFSEQDLIRFFDMLLRLESDLRWTSEPRFHLEIGCIKLAKVGQLRDIENVIRDLAPAGTPSVAGTTPEPKRAAAPPRPQPPSPKAQKNTTLAKKIPPGPKGAGIEASPPPAKSASATPVIPGSATDTPDARPAPPPTLPFTEAYRQKIEQRSKTTGLYLEGVKSIRQNQDLIQIEVPSPTVRTALESPEHFQVLEAAASELLGRPASVSLIMNPSSKGPVETDEDSPLKESVEKETLVQNFLDVFRGEIAHVKSAKKPDER